MELTLTAIIAIILGLAVVLIIGFWLLFLKKPARAAWKDKIVRKYREVMAKNIDKKYLVIELDKIMESALQAKFNTRESFGSILKKNSKSFGRDRLNEIWGAHKLRNKLVHDIDYQANENQLNHAVISFKRSIQDIIE